MLPQLTCIALRTLSTRHTLSVTHKKTAATKMAGPLCTTGADNQTMRLFVCLCPSVCPAWQASLLPFILYYFFDRECIITPVTDGLHVPVFLSLQATPGHQTLQPDRLPERQQGKSPVCSIRPAGRSRRPDTVHGRPNRRLCSRNDGDGIHQGSQTLQRCCCSTPRLYCQNQALPNQQARKIPIQPLDKI
jgi:hypothetical protein